MDKILIIGKSSFLGANLKKKLSTIFAVDNLSYETIMKKKLSFFEKYTHIINCCLHKNYIMKKYNLKYDLDYKFISKIKKITFIYIYFNTRKIYKPSSDISENCILKPSDNYAKNKLLTESYLKSKIKKNLVSLRISNIIGKRIHSRSRKGHQLFIDNFLDYRKKKNKMIIKNDFKDFLTIEQFCKIVKEIIKNRIIGIYNVSLSKKVYISELLGWLDEKFYNSVKFVDSKHDSFTLSNKKIMRKIKITITKKELEFFCKNLFK